MKNIQLFNDDGHIARWVFLPPTWGKDGFWCDGFSEAEKKELFNHLNSCNVCSDAQIKATFYWAELQPHPVQVKLIDQQPSIVDRKKPSDILPFDEYPQHLLEQVIQFSKGKLITIERDESGRVKQIKGEIDGEIESDVVFVYDEDTTTIHCYCHNPEDDPVSDTEKITFADFHIDRSRYNQIHYTLDITDFLTESKSITRFHTDHKISIDENGKVVKILHDNQPWYKADYNEFQKIANKQHSIITTGYQYIDNRLIRKTAFTNNDFLEELTFEYAEDQPGPVRIFKKTDSSYRLIALNLFCKSIGGVTQIELEFDGVPRYYFNNAGNLILKLQLPKDPDNAYANVRLTRLSDITETLSAVEMVVVDDENGNMRIILKKEGKTYIDQTAIFKNGVIHKFINQADAETNTMLSAHFLPRHWSELIEVDNIPQ